MGHIGGKSDAEIGLHRYASLLPMMEETLRAFSLLFISMYSQTSPELGQQLQQTHQTRSRDQGLVHRGSPSCSIGK